MKSKTSKLLIYVIEAFFTALAFSTANRLITPEEVLAITDSNNIIITTLAKLQLNYLNGYGVNLSIIFILLTYFYYTINKNKVVTDKRLSIITSISGFLFATFMTIGNRFLYNISITNSNFQLLVTLINYIGYFFIFKNLLVFFIILLKNKCQVTTFEKNEKYNKFLGIIRNFKNKHPIIFFMLLFLICWLPYIIIFYPGTMNSDSIYSVGQCWRLLPWNTHFPIFPTILYAGFMSLGHFLLNNDNLGLFLCNIFQVILASLLLSYSLNYIWKLTKNKKAIYLIFIFFAFFPTWPIHFYTEVKDVFFAMAVLLFVICSIKFVMSNGIFNKKDWFLYICSMIFTYLFRNNGIHVILLSFPFLLLVVKKNERIKLLVVSIITIILCMSFTKIYTSIFNIEKGPVREVLSIPLQQTAYYVHNYELTDEESSAISKVVDIQDLKQYFIPESVDFVKAQYKETSTNEDLKNYLITWFKMFFKHPGIYFKATLNSTYGYFYPNRVEYKDGVAQYIIHITRPFNNDENKLDLHFLSETQNLRNIIERFTYMLRNMPFIGLLFSCGLYNWILIAITLIMIYFKKFKELVVLTPLYVILLVCIASPVNAYVRYMLPIMLSLPFIITWIINLIKSDNLSIK